MRSSVDRVRWNALLKYDSELGMVANKLRTTAPPAAR